MQEVEYRSVGTREISWKAVSLNHPKVLSNGISYYFLNQARFAYSRFAAETAALPQSALCAFNKLMQSRQLDCAANHYRAYDWLIEWYCHGFRRFLMHSFFIQAVALSMLSLHKERFGK